MRIGKTWARPQLIRVSGQYGERATYKDGNYSYVFEIKDGVPTFKFGSGRRQDYGEIRFPKPGTVEFNRWKEDNEKK